MRISSIRSRGFTLIELLVVIAIIGLLASVVLASLNSAREKGADAKRISEIKQVMLALEFYYDSEGSYPTTCCRVGFLDDELVPDYMPTLPQDPESTTVGDALDYRYYSVDPYAGFTVMVQQGDSSTGWCTFGVGDPGVYNPWDNGSTPHPTCSSL